MRLRMVEGWFVSPPHVFLRRIVGYWVVQCDADRLGGAGVRFAVHAWV